MPPGSASAPDRTGTTSRAAFSGYGYHVSDAERRAWRDMMNARAQEAFRRGQHLVAQGRAAESLLWLGRAERLARTTPNVAFAYAAAALTAGQFEACLLRAARLNRRFAMREAAFMEAICLMRLSRLDEAAAVMGTALSANHAGVELTHVIRDLVRAVGRPGWCTLSNSGRLRVEAAGPVTLTLDGISIGRGHAAAYDLPPDWRRAEKMEVRAERRHLLGSPIDIRRLTRCQSLVWPEASGLSGWLWHPGEPDYVPWLQPETGPPIRVEALATDVDSDAPLSRPRAFHLPITLFPDPNAEVMLRDGNGRPLSGAPLRPIMGRLLAGDLRGLPPDLTPAPVRPVIPRAASPRVSPGCAVVIPVYRDAVRTLACLRSVLASVPEDVPVVVVEDATPERALEVALDRLVVEGRIRLLRNPVNMGFPVSANRGLRAVAGLDVVLLNSDTLVPPGWFERLRMWLATDDIGTVTPFSNDASILSYPSVTRPNPTPDMTAVRRLDRICQRGQKHSHVDLPTANGFCMAISAECLAETGLLREDLFAQGYGEENDFCLRASARGFRHIAATDVYVGHVGSASFGGMRSGLLARNLRTLNALHPGYDALVREFVRRDPLGSTRRDMDMARLRALRLRRTVLMLQHDAGGGVGRVVQDRARRFTEAGSGVLCLRPTATGCVVDVLGQGDDYPGLRFSLPDEGEMLVGLLRDVKPALVEWHHLVGHAPWIRGLHEKLGVPYDVFVHDHVWFCPRISLLDGNGRYCGEPDIAGCERCIARWGSYLSEDISVSGLVARSAGELALARRLVAPSRDTARRLERHFRGTVVEVEPLEDDFALASVPLRASVRRAGVLRVCVLGGISRWKGYDILLDLARDIRVRGLPILLCVVGHTPDDDALMAEGVVVTGEYRESEAEALIVAQGADVGFIPSIAPETWCYALGHLRRAELPVLCFDLGAQGERARAWGNAGRVVPLGMPPAMLADFMLREWGGW